MAKEKEVKYIESLLYKGKVKIRFYPESHIYYVDNGNGEGFKRKTGVTTLIGIKDKSKPLGIWQQQIVADFLLGKLEKGKIIDEDAVVEAILLAETLKDEAADIGKEIHDWCERHIRHKLKQKGFEKLPDMPKFPEAIMGINAFFEFEKSHKIKWVSTERPVYSKEHDYIGTMDLEAIIDGLYCNGDFKSSNGLYNQIRMQTEAYARADEEEFGKRKYEGRWAIRFSKYTEAEYYKRENRKKHIKKAISRISGKEFKDYPIKPYQIFEAQFLDNQKSYRNRDFAAFINCKELFRWNNETDSHLNGGSLE